MNTRPFSQRLMLAVVSPLLLVLVQMGAMAQCPAVLLLVAVEGALVVAAPPQVTAVTAREARVAGGAGPALPLGEQEATVETAGFASGHTDRDNHDLKVFSISA